jgi:phytoene/squalene synthetase
VYLPQEDLARFGCSERDIGNPTASAAFIELVRFEVERAWEFYRRRSIAAMISPGSRLHYGPDPDLQRHLKRLKRFITTSWRSRTPVSRESAWIMLRGGTGLFR